MDVVPETINRIRLSDDELVLLQRVIKKVDNRLLTEEEKEFHHILSARIRGRLTLLATQRLR